MGIVPATLRMLVREVKERSIRGTVLTLGAQDVWATEVEVRALLSAENQPCHSFVSRTTASDLFEQLGTVNDAVRHYVHARSLFEMLGFTEYSDLDNSDRDAATVMHDLNTPFPAELTSAFDLVLDFGTAEHVFHFGNVLMSVAAAAKAGGVVVHSLPYPCSYWAQHGYYCANPDLLWDFYTANGFTDFRCRIVYYEKPLGRPIDHRIYFSKMKAFDYHPGLPVHLLVPPSAIVGTWFSAKKTGESHTTAIPVQGHSYGTGATAIALGSSPVPVSSKLRRALRAAYFVAQPLAGGLERRLLMRAMGVHLQSL